MVAPNRYLKGLQKTLWHVRINTIPLKYRFGAVMSDPGCENIVCLPVTIRIKKKYPEPRFVWYLPMVSTKYRYMYHNSYVKFSIAVRDKNLVSCRTTVTSKKYLHVILTLTFWQSYGHLTRGVALPDIDFWWEPSSMPGPMRMKLFTVVHYH